MLVVACVKCRKIIGESEVVDIEEIKACPYCEAERKFIKEIEYRGGCGCG